MSLLLLTLLGSAWVARQYARQPSDPDFGLFALAALTGTRLADIVDCKSPAIHLWYMALARLVGRDEYRVRLAHQLAVSWGGALLAWGLTGSGAAALAFATIAQSGWLMAFHGNVGQLPAVLLLPALLAGNVWVACAAAVAVVFIEPKLGPSMALIGLLRGWWAPGLASVAVLALVWLALPRSARALLIEWVLTIPGRMHARRVKERLYGEWMPWYVSQPLVMVLPWLAGALLARPDWRYWLPLALYAALVAYGRAVRGVHFFPAAAWVAGAGIAPEWALALAATDWASAGLYLPSLWLRFYGSLKASCDAAEAAGKWLRDKPGSLWVNGMETQVYVYAGKPCRWGMTEQLEVRIEIAPERRRLMQERWKAGPADWVVIGRHPGVKFRPTGYRLAREFGPMQVYKRV